MNKKVVIYFCLLGFFLRAIYIFFFNPDLSWADEKRFWSEATSLIENFTMEAKGKVAHDMPLTAFVIAGVSLVSNESILAVKVFFAGISALTIYYIAALSHQIYPTRYTGIIAAAIASVYPYFIYYSSLLLSETIFLLLIVLLFLQLLKMDENNRNSLKLGAIAGFAHLSRPTLLLFYPVAVLWKYFLMKGSVRGLVIAVILFSVIVAPWGVSNYLRFGEFRLSTSGSGQALWEGNNPWNKTGSVSGSFSDPEAYLEEVPEHLNEFEADDWKKQQAVQYIKENPAEFVDLSIKKFFRFWNLWPNSAEHQSAIYKLISLLSFLPMLLLSIVFIVVFIKDFKRLSILYLFVAYYTAIHMITIGSIRYRLPLEPLLVAMAACVLAYYFNANVRQKRDV
jgi:hypothetical protein